MANSFPRRFAFAVHNATGTRHIDGFERRRLDTLRNHFAEFLLRDGEIVFRLQIHPDLRGSTEVARQPERGVRTHSSLAIKNFNDSTRGNGKVKCESIRAESSRFEFLAQDVAGMCKYLTRCHIQPL